MLFFFVLYSEIFRSVRQKKQTELITVTFKKLFVTIFLN